MATADEEGRRSTPRSGRGDPLGKRALFEAGIDAPDDLIAAGHDKSGRDALFSVGSPKVGTVVIECGSCTARSRRSIADAALRMARLSVWIPGRKFNRHLECPACGDRTWCRIGWLE